MNTHVKISFFVLICALVAPVLTLAQWIQLNSGTSDWLKGIDCPTPDICYVVGWSPTMALKTIDGGNNWFVINSGLSSQQYFGIECLNKDTCLILNGNSEFYKTIDGGSTWTQKNAPIGNTANQIFMVNDSIGYASAGGGNYLKTTDGGETWQWLNLFLTGAVLWPVYFINEQTGFFGNQNILGNSSIFKTNDGGNNWSVSLTGAPCDFYGIDFPTDSVGYAIGSENPGCIYKTIDQGTN